MKKSIWDWLAYVAIAGIVVWVFLRGFGIINTPFLIEYYPYLAVAYAFGWQVNKLNDVSSEFKTFRSKTIKQVNEIKINCAGRHGK